jgi:hypothetical protein
MRGTAGDIPGAETGRAPPIAAVDTAHPALESYSFATDPALPIAAVDTAHAAWESYRLVFVQCHSSALQLYFLESPA